MKVKRKNKNRVYSFKYTGPERAAKLLEGEWGWTETSRTFRRCKTCNWLDMLKTFGRGVLLYCNVTESWNQGTSLFQFTNWLTVPFFDAALPMQFFQLRQELFTYLDKSGHKSNLVLQLNAIINRARWTFENQYHDPPHMFFNIKFNFKASLFSSTFWFERSFRSGNAILVFGPC